MGEATVTGDEGRCPTSEELQLLFQWHALQSGFRQLNTQLLSDVEVSSGMAPSSFQVLWFLLTTPDRSAPMHQVSQLLGFSTAGTTKVVDRLCEAGLVERRPSRTDRRVTFAALTPSGIRTATDASLKLARALRQRIVEPLGEERFVSLADAVSTLSNEAPSCPEAAAAS